MYNLERAMNKEIQTYDEKLQRAIAVIKEAILQGQYEACKGVNRIQLAVYFGIGKYIYISIHERAFGVQAPLTSSAINCVENCQD